MNRENNRRRGDKLAGIRLNRMNILMICIGLIIATLMAVSMYRTTVSVKEIVTVTNNYLSNQSAGGMLRDFATNLGEQAMAFVQSGEVGSAKSYEAQMEVINARLAQYEPETSNSAAANSEFTTAMEAFRARNSLEISAMRLAAATMPAPQFEALPDFLKNEELSEEDQALPDEDKKGKALSLLTSDSYAQLETTIRESIDRSHRLSSEEGQQQADQTFTEVRNLVGNQMVLVILFVIVSALALMINRMLIIAPIQKSVDNLDHREPIPEKGSYEMRHLARVYNEVLKENEEKENKLSYAASHDALTGVYNRTDFDRYYRKIEKMQNVGLIVLDVDHFKQYNDDFGHDIGDQVLCTAVEAMKRHFRTEDHISRIGGDEFCIIMPGTGQADGKQISEKILEINRELSEQSGDLPPVTISAGIAFWNRPNPEGSLFKDADTALLNIKRTREDCCEVWGGIK